MSERTGDGWVDGPDGRRFWGRFGAAGLLAVDEQLRVLLQHRALFSHNGGTWGLPGGARDVDEDALAGALREAWEEAAVPAHAVEPWFEHVVDHGFWSYTTCVVRVIATFDAAVSDHESLELRWVHIDEVDSYELHPGLAEEWPALRDRIRHG